MRRLIGISLACLVTSACAIDKTPEESTSNPPDDPARFPQANGETPTDKSSVSGGTLLADRGPAAHGSERVEPRLAGFEPAADACGGSPNPCCSPLRTTGTTLFGKAAWYNLVGRQTASGETLDTATATAAHRSLPLASYAKVDEPCQRPLRRRKDQRSGSIHSRTHPRSLAACCRRARYEARWGGGGRR